MNKKELVEAMASKSGLTLLQNREALDAIVDIISEELVNGEKVPIVGFGTFLVTERVARMGMNPKTKCQIPIQARKVPAFRAGSTLRNCVNQK